VYKENLAKIRELIREMATAPEDDLEYVEYAALSIEAYDLRNYLDSVAEGLEIASSEECTELLAKVCDELVKTIKERNEP